MTYAQRQNGVWRELRPTFPVVAADGRQASWETFTKLSVAEQESLGGFVVPEPTAPEGKVETARFLKPTGAKPSWDVTYVDAPAPDLDALKAAKKADVDAISDAKMAAGYPRDFGASYGVKVLQTRDSDKPNWLALAQTATAAIIQGQPNAPLGAIRTQDNVNVPVTAQVALATMLGMQAYLAPILANAWALKDAIAAAPDTAALNAIDINAGWPA